MATKIKPIDMRAFYKDKDGNEIEIFNYTGKDLELILERFTNKDKNPLCNSTTINIPIVDEKEFNRNDPRTILLSQQDSIRDRLPNSYDTDGNEIIMADGHNRFMCESCLQGLIIESNGYYIISNDEDLYRLRTTEIDLSAVCEAYKDEENTIEEKYEILNGMKEDFSVITKELNSSLLEKIQITKDNETFCTCPMCGETQTFEDIINKYEFFARENNVCKICGIGDISYIVNRDSNNNESGNNIRCDSCLF